LAFAEAQRHFERALELWDQVPDPAMHTERNELLEQAADVALWVGNVDRALELVRQALAEVDKARAPIRAGVLHERLGRGLWRDADNEGALAAFVEASRLLAGAGATPERARAIAAEGAALMIAGRYSESRARCQEAIAIAETIDAGKERGFALSALGVSLTMLGDVRGGIDALRRAQAIAEKSGDFEDLYRVYGNLSFTLDVAGQLEEAVEVALRGLEVAGKLRIEESTVGATVLLNATDLLIILGRWQEAADLVRNVPHLDKNARFGPYLEVSRAQIDLSVGRFDSARQHLQVARRASSLTEPNFLGLLHSALAELAIWEGDQVEARAAVREGFERLGSNEDDRAVLRLCAMALRAEADEAELARGTGSTHAVEAGRARGAALLARAREQHQASSLPEARCLAGLCNAEHARLEADLHPALWEATATAWEELRHRYRAAYARWRHAEALLLSGARAHGATILRQAHRAAQDIHALPVRRELESLAHRNGVELWQPTTDART
ncbi:MAG TPA: hypothetical protein VGF31_09060, partial [Myxococcaceae bacterium]